MVARDTRAGARARWVALVAPALLALGGVACGGDDAEEAEARSVDTSAPEGTAGAVDLALGEEVYQANCAECHGADLRGTDKGPSHLSIVYEPDHHPDAAFVAAISQGSTAHHWDFGDMPPVEGLDEDEVASVIAYVRSVQDSEGFEDYPPG
jgi:mono/diheme cytochrome c family protein